MSEKIFESISALMDDEADDLELRRLLKEMEANDSLASVWSRYHVAKAVIHKEMVYPHIDLTGRVRNALESERAHSQSIFNKLPKMAAVAAVAMFSVLLTAKLVVNQSVSTGGAGNLVAAIPNVVNPNIQRAGYIIGQPNGAIPLKASRSIQYNDVQRVDVDAMPRGYIVLPTADIPSDSSIQK